MRTSLRQLNPVFLASVVLVLDPVLALAQPETTEQLPDADDAQTAPEPSDPGAATIPDADAQEAGGPEPDETPERPDARVHTDDAADTITIIGTRLSETSGSAHRISETKLARFEYDDPTAVLLSIPGVYARGEDGIGLRNNIGLRGVNPDRSKKVTLLEDGILFAPAPYSAPAAYYFPLITRMTGIEVLKGPASIAHGPYTIAGAVDLATRATPSATSAYLDLAGGEYGYGKLHSYVGGSSDGLSFLIEGVHVRTTGFKHLPIGGETGSIRNEWMGKLAYVIDTPLQQELRFRGTYSDEDSDETYLGLTDEDFRRDPLQRYAASQLDHMRANRQSVVLTHVLQFEPEISLTTNAYYHHYYRSWRRAKNFTAAPLYQPLVDPSNPMWAHYADVLRGRASSVDQFSDYLYIGPNERDFHSMGIDTRLRAHFKTGALAHHVEAGARLHYDSVDRRHYEDAYIVGADGSLTPGMLPTVTSTFEHVGSLAFAGYLSDGVTLGPVTLTPGVRLELIEFGVDNHLLPAGFTLGTFRTSAVLPALGAYVQLFEGFGLLGGISRGFSPPVPPTRPVVSPTLAQEPLDNPELSINYEAGARYMRAGTRFEAIGFYNAYGNLTDVCTASSGCAEVNLDRQFSAGEATIYGVEAYAEHTLQLGAFRLPINASYTFTRGTFDNAFSSDDPIFGMVAIGDFMPYLPEHQLRGSVGLEHPRFGVEIGVMYMAPMREQASKLPVEQVAVRTDEQLIWDLDVQVHINDWWSVYGNLRNVFNQLVITGHRPFGAKVNAPRWLQIGTKLTY